MEKMIVRSDIPDVTVVMKLLQALAVRLPRTDPGDVHDRLPGHGYWLLIRSTGMQVHECQV
jgi:hypothetical protein